MNDVKFLDKPRTLLTVKQFSERHPAFSQGGLRHLIFLSRTRQTSRGEVSGNGLDAALVRVGRRVLIDEARFFAWLDAQPGNSASRAGSACTESVENLRDDIQDFGREMKWIR